MKIEQQVVSLELAKKLKELGVRESQYNWLVASDGARLMRTPVASTYSHFDQYPASTVAELGELLPDGGLWAKDSIGTVRTFKSYGVWWSEYCVGTDSMPSIMCSPKLRACADSEADARAKMLISLFENRIVTP